MARALGESLSHGVPWTVPTLTPEVFRVIEVMFFVFYGEETEGRAVLDLVEWCGRISRRAA